MNLPSGIFFLVFVLEISCFKLQGQPFRASILKKVVEDTTFAKSFTLCEFKSDSIIIIDTAGYFTPQMNTVICGKKVVVTNVPRKEKGRNIIYLIKLVRKKKSYELFFVTPSDNSTLRYLVIKKRKKIKVTLIGQGAF